MAGTLSINGAFNYPVELLKKMISRSDAQFEGQIIHGTNSDSDTTKKYNVSSGLKCSTGTNTRFSWAIGDSSAVSGNFSLSIGESCESVADYSVACGSKARTKDSHSFVWQGQYGESANVYESKGNGTFAVNPKYTSNVLEGFFVGDKNLKRHIEEQSYATLSGGNNVFDGTQTYNNNCTFNSTVEFNGQTTLGQGSTSDSPPNSIANVGYVNQLHSDILSGDDIFTGNVTFSNGFSVGSNNSINFTNVNLTIKEPLSGTVAENEPATTKFVKSLTIPLVDSLSGYVATSGDTMTGPIEFQTDQAVYGKDGDVSRLQFSGGSEDGCGASLLLCGANSNVGDVNADSGAFVLQSKMSGAASAALVGRPDGVLKWNERNIVRSVNVNGVDNFASDNGVVNLGNIKQCAAGGNEIYTYSSWRDNGAYDTLYNTGNSVVYYKNNTDGPVMVNISFIVNPQNGDNWTTHVDVTIKNRNNIETTVLRYPCIGGWNNSTNWSGLVCSGDEVGIKYVPEGYPPSQYPTFFAYLSLELLVSAYRAVY